MERGRPAAVLLPIEEAEDIVLAPQPLTPLTCTPPLERALDEVG
ncbi:hypothetical protein [Gaiella sp.]